MKVSEVITLWHLELLSSLVTLLLSALGSVEYSGH